MAHNHALITNIGGTTTTIYLSNTNKTAYSGSGTPWTNPTTSPFLIGMNEETGPMWAPRRAEPAPIVAGGPPFISGSQVLQVAYQNITQTIPLQVYATSHDNAVAAIQILKRALKLARWHVPPILQVQPDGATNAVYYEVYDGEIDENPISMNAEARTKLFRAQLVLTCSPFGGRLTTPETLINAATFTNIGTGSNNNTQSLGTGAGDLIYEGQPLNIDVEMNQDDGQALWLGSVYSRAYSTTGAATLTTSSTTGTTATLATWDITAVLTRPQLRGRVLVTGVSSSNMQYRVEIYFGAVNNLVYTSRWTTPGAAIDAPLADFGPIPFDYVRRIKGITAPTCSLILRYRSSNGSSASLTLTNTQYLLYYDWCQVNSTTLGIPGGYRYRIDGFSEQTNATLLPHAPRAFVVQTGVTNMYYTLSLRGQAPRYFSGASLFVAWVRSTAPQVVTTDTARVTVTHAPLYRTLRGNG